MKPIKDFLLIFTSYLFRIGCIREKIISLSEQIKFDSSSFKVYNRKIGPPFQIFFYHRILPYTDPYAIDFVNVRYFEKQISMLSRSFKLVTLGELSESINRGIIAPRTVCITFDDGYLDNFEYAFPILKRYNVPATIFLTTGYIGTNNKLWHDRLSSIIKYTKNSVIPSEFCGEPLNVNTIQERKIAAKKMLEWVKQFKPQERDSYIENFESKCCRNSKPNKRLMLNWNEVREMNKAGIEFGSHTITHPILSLLGDEMIDREIFESKSEIEYQIGKTVKTFAYPNGQLSDFDKRSVDTLKKYGYSAAVTTCQAANDLRTDPFKLSRESVWEMNPEKLFVRMIKERLFY